MIDTFALKSPKSAHRLGAYLREGHDATLARRRKVVALSLVSASAMGVITLYQTGWLKKVPGLPIKGFDGCKINRADQAYQLLSTPDALLGLTSYALTASLAATGGKDRPALVPLALGAKATIDAAAAAKLLIDQPLRYKAFCALCLLAAFCTFGVLPLVYPEARRAAGELLHGRRR